MQKSAVPNIQMIVTANRFRPGSFKTCLHLKTLWIQKYPEIEYSLWISDQKSPHRQPNRNVSISDSPTCL